MGIGTHGYISLIDFTNYDSSDEEDGINPQVLPPSPLSAIGSISNDEPMNVEKELPMFLCSAKEPSATIQPSPFASPTSRKVKHFVLCLQPTYFSQRVLRDLRRLLHDLCRLLLRIFRDLCLFLCLLLVLLGFLYLCFQYGCLRLQGGCLLCSVLPRRLKLSSQSVTTTLDLEDLLPRPPQLLYMLS
jgi:hypothetical protein